MNLYSFLKKKHSKPFLGAFFAVIFLASFFGLKTLTFANPATDGSEPFIKLFDKGATLSSPTWTFNTTTTTPAEATFPFRGGFLAESNGLDDTTAKSAIWYWDHIAQNERLPGSTDETTKNIFLIRTCPLDSSSKIIESKCYFIKVPLNYNASAIGSSCTAATGAGGLLGEVQCTNSVVDNIFKERFYKYQIKATKVVGDLGTYETGTGKIFVADKTKSDFTVNIKASKIYSNPGANDTDLTEIPFNSLFSEPASTIFQSEFWYCGGNKELTSNTDILPTPTATTLAENPDMRVFGKICKGQSNRPYFKIAQTAPFLIPRTASEVDPATGSTLIQPDEGNNQANINATEDGNLPGCGVLGLGTIAGCIAQGIYYVIYWPIQWVAGIMGKALDFFLGYSISDESYRASVITTGWKLVRDISNIFFIIILIWTGLATVFNIEGISMKKVVPQLIINALLINFSLFGTQLVIDISNITARVFYNTMNICAEKKCTYDSDGKITNLNKETTGGYKPLSVGIVASFNPQGIFSPSVLSQEGTNINKQGSATLKSEAINNINSNDYAGYFIIVTLVAAFIMLGLAKMFFSVMFMFVGRVVGLYLVMIFSPFAVLTKGGMPIVGSIPEISWKDWVKDLTNYAMLAPIFVFFMYIIYAFINSDMMNLTKITNEGGFMGVVLSILIPMAIIYMLIQSGVGITKKFSGKAGEMVNNWLTSGAGLAVGGAIGLATGGLGLAGRRAIGAVASSKIGTWAATNKGDNVLASGTNKLLKWGQKTSFDVRNTKMGEGINSGLGAMGIKTKDVFSSALGIGQKDYTGGNIETAKRKKKEEEKKATEKTDMSHLNDAQAKQVWENISKKEIEATAEKTWEKKRMDALEDEVKAKGGGDVKKLREEAVEKTTKLEEAVKAGDVAQQTILKKELEDNATQQSTIMAPLVEKLKKEKTETDYKSSESYKENLKEVKSQFETKYGEVKNAKELSAAMRFRYAEDMLADSFLLSEGKKRGGFKMLQGLVSGGWIVEGWINEKQDAKLGALKGIVDEFQKTHDPEKNIKMKLEKELTSINKLMEDHIKSVIEKGEKPFEELTPKEKEEHFERARSNAGFKAERAEDNYKDLNKEYKDLKKAGTATKEDLEKLEIEVRKAYDETREAKDKFTALSNAQKEKETKEFQLEKEKIRIQEKSDNKKEANKPNDSSKPKESK